MHVAILGAPQTGKTQLTLALRQALNAQGVASRITDDAPWQESQTHDVVLLCGLDLAPASPSQLEADAAIRHRLHSQAMNYQVVYGSGLARLNNALFGLAQQMHAKGLEALASQIRQPPPVRWQGPCDTCGDGDCEHQLFSRLLAKTQ
jgi:hypothetical protein